MSNARAATPLQEEADSAHPAVTRIAAVAGILVVTALTFGTVTEAGFLLHALGDRFPPSVRSDVYSGIVKCGYTVVLALIAFGVARRRPAFFGIRRITKEDVLAILKTLSVLFATVIVLRLVQEFLSPATAATTAAANRDTEDLPLLYGLGDAVVAGLAEEFAYRGYLIEELGQLSRNRILAAAVSVVFFGLAHVRSGYGWSIELLYPTLVGLALTALYLWRRNLWACVLVHAGLDAIYSILHAI